MSRQDKEPDELPEPTDPEDQDRDTAYADADEPLDEPLDREATDADDDLTHDEEPAPAEAEVEGQGPAGTADSDLAAEADLDELAEADLDELDDHSDFDDEAAAVQDQDEAAEADVTEDEVLAEARDDYVAAAEEPPRPGEASEDEALAWYDNRWREIQIAFVDQPRDSVANADRLVADVIEQLTKALHAERTRLAGQWGQEGTSTEDLRIAFQGYRAFFERLTSA